tara:strand:+ start:648 stop:998 length:351 start_codon:yes stop_codon:yes gene_type:complete
MTLTDIQIQKIIKQYQNKRHRENEKYQNELRHDKDWMKQNTEKSKEYYYKNCENIKMKYQDNKEYIKCRNLFHYYKNNNKVEDYISKFPEKLIILDDNGFDYKKYQTENKIIKMFG